MNNMNRRSSIDKVRETLPGRYRKERLFKAMGIASLSFGILALLVLFADIFSKGLPAFQSTYIAVNVNLDAGALEIDDINDSRQLRMANYTGQIKKALRKQFPEVKKRKLKRQLYALVSSGAGYELEAMLRDDPELLNTEQQLWLVADDDVDTYYKTINDDQPFVGKVSEQQIAWVAQLQQDGLIEKRFNSLFFSNGDSREPELAGIGGAISGSFTVSGTGSFFISAGFSTSNGFSR